MIQCRKYWFITFFLNRRYLRFQDSWISDPAKAPNALCSNQTPFLRVLREDGVCGYPPPSCQLRNFTHRWLGNRPATACEHQVKCLWQPCSFQLLCSDNVIRKKKRRKKKDIKFDVSSSRRNKHIIKGVLAYISLSSHMCLPSKTYRHPHGFCGAEMNVTANKSKGKGLRFGGFVFTPSLFFCPDMTELLPNLEHNCLW